MDDLLSLGDALGQYRMETADGSMLDTLAAIAPYVTTADGTVVSTPGVLPSNASWTPVWGYTYPQPQIDYRPALTNGNYYYFVQTMTGANSAPIGVSFPSPWQPMGPAPVAPLGRPAPTWAPRPLSAERSGVLRRVAQAVFGDRERDEAELRRRREEDEAMRQRARERRDAERAAEAKALDLLRRHLSPAQLEEWEQHERFHTRSPSGRIFRIDLGSQGNILELDPVGRRPLARFCVHAQAELPDADNVLAQKLLIERDERRFLALANRQEIRYA